MIDRAAGISPGSELAALRRARADNVRLSQASHDAALNPRDCGNISRGERAALACRMARLLKDERLERHYRELLDAAGDAETAPVADPDGQTAPDPRLTAIVRHVELVTLTPALATRTDIEQLKSAGLTDRDIVTLSGLIAFVNYQARVAAGLRLLGSR
ncbi:MAG: CMD domain protein [Rhizobiales bacterium]|nr:CMD domain protein [Hyphomicrobiales bacterium]